MDNRSFESFKYSGKEYYELDGLLFTAKKRGEYFLYDFLIQTISEPTKIPIRIRMEPDQHPPHVHLQIASQHHVATISLDGRFLNCKKGVPNNVKRIVHDWVVLHNTTLRRIWDNSLNDPLRKSLIGELDLVWEYEGHKYQGKKPVYEREYGGIRIWYNGSLSEATENGKVCISSSDCMCIWYPKGYDLVNSPYKFMSDCIQTNKDE